MATKFCQQCRQEHPGRECDYDPNTGKCIELENLNKFILTKYEEGTDVQKDKTK